MNSIDLGTISVCQDCLHAYANGEYDPDRPADLPEPLSNIGPGYSVTVGMDYSEHADSCPVRAGDRDAECDCEEFGFCTTSCVACGDTHHGDRYAMTLWRDSPTAYVVTFDPRPVSWRSQLDGLRRLALPDAREALRMADRPGRIIDIDTFEEIA